MVGNRHSAEWKRHLRAGVLVAAFSIGLALIPAGQFLWNFSYDLPFSVRPEADIRNAAIVYMDDDSHAALGQPYSANWDRQIHAQFIDRMARFGVKVIVFDLMFDETNGPASDRQLVEAARRHGKVVVAAKITPMVLNGDIVAWQPLVPFPDLQKVARVGAVESADDRRLARLHYEDPGVNIPSMARIAAELFLGHPIPARKEQWLNHYGPPGTIPWHSYHEVLRDDAVTATLSNKVIFVGARIGIGFTGGRGTDDFATPYTMWTGLRSPGVEVTATAFLNLLRREWLARAPLGITLSILGAIALLLPVMLGLLRPVAASIVAVCAAAGIFVIAAAVMHTFHWWFPWLVVSGLEIPGALACVLILKLQSETLRPASEITTTRPASSAAPRGSLESTVIHLPTVPDFVLLRDIGSGAYGNVWLAQNIVDSFRAVKVVFRDRFQEDRPFDREFEGIKYFESLSNKHPGLVQIFHVGRNSEGGYFYYVMELADDANESSPLAITTYKPRTLASDIAKRGALPVAECVRLAANLSESLAFLHGEGLVHRDIKPGNIIYSGGKPKIADIGLVTQIGENRSFVGTEGYMPPKDTGPGTGTVAADIFALGRTLYRAFTGFPVERFPDLPTRMPEPKDAELCRAFNQVILKACETKSRRRYGSAADLHQSLKELLPLGSSRAA